MVGDGWEQWMFTGALCPLHGLPGVLVYRHNRLLSGSNMKRIRLWAVAAVQELRLKGPDAR